MLKESLPIPLSAIEHYFFADDRPDYPMTFWGYFQFSRKLNVKTLKKAIHQAVALHPRFSAVIQGHPRNKTSDLFWVESELAEPHIQSTDGNTPLRFPKGIQINLHEEAGLRVFIREDLLNTRLYLQVHHACCDGFSMISFLAEFLRYYCEIEGESADHILPFLSSRIASSQLQVKESRSARTWRSLPIDFYEILSFLLRPIQRIAIPIHNNSNPNSLIAIPSIDDYCFSKEDTRRLIHSACRQSATLNDLMLRDLFLTIRKWNMKYHTNPTKGYIRIMLPINMRTSMNNCDKLGNEVSMVAIDAPSRYFASPQLLLKKILKRTGKIKNYESITSLFRSFLHQVGRIRGGMTQTLKEERIFATTVFSLMPLDSLLSFLNMPLGKIFEDLGLTKMLSIPPLRKTTPVAFGAILFDKRLNIAIHYDPQSFSMPQGKEFLQLYVNQLKNSMNPNS